MIKKTYAAPAAEWLEAEYATSFLAESDGGTIPSLEDGGWDDITW